MSDRSLRRNCAWCLRLEPNTRRENIAHFVFFFPDLISASFLQLDSMVNQASVVLWIDVQFARAGHANAIYVSCGLHSRRAAPHS